MPSASATHAPQVLPLSRNKFKKLFNRRAPVAERGNITWRKMIRNKRVAYRRSRPSSLATPLPIGSIRSCRSGRAISVSLATSGRALTVANRRNLPNDGGSPTLGDPSRGQPSAESSTRGDQAALKSPRPHRRG